MKKRVRIYKAPDGEGKFINKTAQFLQKAQEGGMPSVDQIGYPGAGQQSQETDDNQLASAVLTDISNSEPRERIIIKLVNVYGKDPMEAQQFVDQMYQYVEQQQQSEVDDAEEEDDSEDVTMGKDTAEVAEVEEVKQGPTGTEMSNEIIDEWDSSGGDDSEVAEGIIMRYGGYPMAQEGMEVPIQMPDVSAYLPSGMEDYLNGNVDPIYGQAWERPAMDSVQDEEVVFSNYAEPELPEEKYGGMPSKRSYVNSVLKLVKKQMGGDSAAPASAKYNDDNSDPTGANVRKKSLDKFIGSVKNQSAMALAKEQAEQQYEQMMQMQQQAPVPQYPMAQDGGEQDIYQGQDYENPMHHLALFSQSMGDVFQDDQNQITQAQFGGLFGGRRNRLNAYTGGYNMPRGFQGMGPISSIDVRRSGWFGRPKEYSIEFAQGSPMPGMGMPGQGVGFYGYGARTIKYPATRIKVESEAASVNNKAKEEVAATTPDSKATTDAAKTDVTTTVSTTTEGTIASTTVPGKTTQTETKTTEGKTETVPVNPVVVKPTVRTEKPGKDLDNGLYSYPGKQGIYRKQDGVWYVDTTGTGTNYQQIKSGDVKARIKALEENATVYKKPKAPVVNIPVPTQNRPDLVADATSVNNIYARPVELKQPNFSTKPYDFNANPSGYQPPVMYQKGTGSNPPKPVLNPLTGQRLPAQYWRQEGGSINDPFMDAYGNLQQFTGGGAEDFTQADIDDMYSKNTANGDFPMAQYGYNVQNLFPANVMPAQYAKMQGVPYDPKTGKPVANYIPGAGTGIKKIDVTKSSWLTGKPKKYTITYGTQEMDPRKQNLITLPGSGTETPESQSRQPQRQRTDVSDLGMRAAMAVRKGERQAYRNDKRLARHPEYWNDMNDMPDNQNMGYPAAEAIGTTPGVDPQKAMDYMRQSLTVPKLPVTTPTATPFSADQLYNPYVGPLNEEMQYGGGLERFIPRAQEGFQSPVVYTNNPAMDGISQVDMISLNPGIQGLGASSMDTSFMNKNTPTRDQSNDPKQYTVDPTQIESHQAENVYAGPEGDVAMDFKTKNSVDPEAYANVANAGMRGITGILNRRDDARKEAKMSDNLTADNLYASDPSKDRGDYDTNSGLYRLDEMGQKWNSRSKQYGGDVFQDGGMVEGDEVFMTDEEIQEFLANGGDLEFI